MPTAPCFLIKVFLINFRFVLANTQRMQYCTMRCNYATIQQYNYATMPLVHPALQSKCKLKDHNRRLHLRQGLATETIVANHSESCETGFGVETVCMEKCWRKVMTAQVYCLPLAKILPTVVFPQAFLLSFAQKASATILG